MRRLALVCCASLVLAGCQLPPEQVPLRPLPEDNSSQAFGDLATRARVQAMTANEAFYLNKWPELEDAARSLQQTSRILFKAADVPVSHRDRLPVEAGDLGKEAGNLREAAKGQQVKEANEILQRINLKVRQLQVSNPVP